MAVPSNAMRFYWNGRNSGNFNIVMTSLPDIVIPKQRYEEIYVDNRPSTIIEKTGWEAYDLSFDIAYIKRDATKEKFVTDMVNLFFNPSSYKELYGRLYFSNCTTIYYNAEFLNGIDFEHFYQYKTATVVFHIQPFKRKCDIDGSSNYPYDITYEFNSLESASTPVWAESTTYIADNPLLNRQPHLRVVMNPNTVASWVTQKYLMVRVRCPFTDSQIPANNTLYLYQKPIVFYLNKIVQACLNKGMSSSNVIMSLIINFETEEYFCRFWNDDSSIFDVFDISKYLVTSSTELASLIAVHADNKYIYKYKDKISGNVYSKGFTSGYDQFSGGNTSSSRKEAVSIGLYNASYASVNAVGICDILYEPQVKLL